MKAENERINAENKRINAEERAARSRQLTFLTFILVIFLILIAVLLFSRYRAKRQANEKLEAKNSIIEETKQGFTRT